MTLKDRPHPRHALEVYVAPTARRRHLSLGRKVLLTVMTVGTIGTTIGAGTFASFTAATQNASNSFAAGTLVLGDKSSTVTTTGGAGTIIDDETTMCLSSTTSAITTNTNSTCGAAFSFSMNKPGATSVVDFNIKNKGSLSGTLTLARGTCGNAPSVSGVEFNVGSGDLCANTSGLYVTLQEYSLNNRSGTLTCWYPTAAAGACVPDTTKTINTLSTSGLNLSALSAGSTRYFRLTLNLLSSAPPVLQGRQATFDLTWQLTS
jgi:hypothetical protein